MVLATSLTLFGCFLFVCVYYWGSLTPNEVTETLVANEAIKVNNNPEPAKWSRSTGLKNTAANFETTFTEENMKAAKARFKGAHFEPTYPAAKTKTSWFFGKDFESQRPSWTDLSSYKASKKEPKAMLIPWDYSKNTYEVRPAWNRLRYRIDK